MPNHESGVTIYRTLAPESLNFVTEAQRRLASVESFQPLETPNLLFLRANPAGELSKRQMQKLIYPLPDTAGTAGSLTVAGLRDHPVYQLRSALDIALDPDDMITSEYKEFRNRGMTVLGKFIAYADFRITIGYLDRHAVTSDIPDIVGPLPNELAFSHIKYEPDIEPPLDPGHSTSATEPVRTLRQGGIPPGFLKSLRPGNTSGPQ